MADISTCGLILEGISGSGKTTLLKALTTSERFLNRPDLSSVILSEHHTQRVLERKQREGGLEKKDNLGLLEGHVSYLEGVRSRLDEMAWCRPGQKFHRVPFLLERFHLTHVLHYDYMDWADVASLDVRLNALDVKLCVLTVSPEELEDRIFERRDEQWNGYIRRFGNTRGEILEFFLKRQARLEELARLSSLDALFLNPTEKGVAGARELLLDLWGIPSLPPG